MIQKVYFRYKNQGKIVFYRITGYSASTLTRLLRSFAVAIASLRLSSNPITSGIRLEADQREAESKLLN